MGRCLTGTPAKTANIINLPTLRALRAFELLAAQPISLAGMTKAERDAVVVTAVADDAGAEHPVSNIGDRVWDLSTEFEAKNRRAAELRIVWPDDVPEAFVDDSKAALYCALPRGPHGRKWSGSMSTAATATTEGNKVDSATRRRSREKTREELQFAMLRVKNKGLKVSISAVAAEAGVTPGLIHNTYPDIAEEIRAQVGRKTRQQRDEKAAELVETKKRMRELREERDAAVADLTKIASINETLRTELATLRASATANVVILPQRVKP